jgi:YHS domain-containing protein
MFRNVFRLILIFIATLFIRQVVLLIMRAFSPGSVATSPRQAPREQSGGELKKDPVCGTFIAAPTAIQKTFGAETYYFCSTACRDKFKR